MRMRARTIRVIFAAKLLKNLVLHAIILRSLPSIKAFAGTCALSVWPCISISSAISDHAPAGQSRTRLHINSNAYMQHAHKKETRPQMNFFESEDVTVAKRMLTSTAMTVTTPAKACCGGNDMLVKHG